MFINNNNKEKTKKNKHAELVWVNSCCIAFAFIYQSIYIAYIKPHCSVSVTNDIYKFLSSVKYCKPSIFQFVFLFTRDSISSLLSLFNATVIFLCTVIYPVNIVRLLSVSYCFGFRSECRWRQKSVSASLRGIK